MQQIKSCRRQLHRPEKLTFARLKLPSRSQTYTTGHASAMVLHPDLGLRLDVICVCGSNSRGRFAYDAAHQSAHDWTCTHWRERATRRPRTEPRVEQTVTQPCNAHWKQSFRSRTRRRPP